MRNHNTLSDNVPVRSPRTDFQIRYSHKDHRQEALAAEAEGLGSCILGWFDEKELKQLAGIPASKRLLLDIVIGYPAKEKRKKIRKPKEKVISYNRY